MKKLFSLLFIFTLVKKIHIFLKFMSVLITFVAINSEEILMNDFVKVYTFNVNTWGKGSDNKNKISLQ